MDFKTLIERGRVILDGAWGTELQARGLPIGACSENWNLENPDAVQDVAQAYVDAGAEIILTNTFGGSRIMLARHGLDAQTSDINRIGAERSRIAAGDQALVFGSIGPCGEILMMGEVSEDDVTAAFAEQAQALADGGADGLVIETMADITEAQCAITAALTTKLPVVCSMVFDHGEASDRTMMGHSPEDAVEALASSGIAAIGANCGTGIEAYIDVCKSYRAATDMPLWIKPNAGVPEMINGIVTYNATTESFAEKVEVLFSDGATCVGGCCGTSPAFIRALGA